MNETETNKDQPFAKKYQAKKGDIISSDNWNALVNEIKRLGDEKVNLSGDRFKGALTIEEALTVKGSVDIEGNLSVDGTISGNINASKITCREVNGDLTIAHSLTVNNRAVKIKGNLSVDGTISGSIDAGTITSGEINGNLIVAGSISIDGVKLDKERLQKLLKPHGYS
ncbi:MAG: polymer-forming cytoskeletal protein [Cyanobacteria bacterium P01_H01_bin.35]